MLDLLINKKFKNISEILDNLVVALDGIDPDVKSWFRHNAFLDNQDCYDGAYDAISCLIKDIEKFDNYSEIIKKALKEEDK